MYQIQLLLYYVHQFYLKASFLHFHFCKFQLLLRWSEIAYKWNHVNCVTMKRLWSPSSLSTREKSSLIYASARPKSACVAICTECKCCSIVVIILSIEQYDCTKRKKKLRKKKPFSWLILQPNLSVACDPHLRENVKYKIRVQSFQ